MNIGLIFGMIVAILMMVMVIVFGYDQLFTVQDMQHEAEFRRVMNSFDNAIDRVYSLGGESSQKFSLSLPSNVQSVCFVPLFTIDDCYNPPCERVEYTDFWFDMESTLEKMNYKDNEIYQLLPILESSREDDMEPVLVFFTTGGAPEWHDFSYLGPSKTEDDDILCISPGTEIWLKRQYDNDGAWVDVEVI
ncbi:MAG: hypothetical protein JW789_01080 [Candidatus Aenigmarchaeota archaeon]|nr:hypothetical protein [Candidatus Aenigmarchaeota archaeon]